MEEKQANGIAQGARASKMTVGKFAYYYYNNLRNIPSPRMIGNKPVWYVDDLKKWSKAVLNATKR